MTVSQMWGVIAMDWGGVREMVTLAKVLKRCEVVRAFKGNQEFYGQDFYIIKGGLYSSGGCTDYFFKNFRVKDNLLVK